MRYRNRRRAIRSGLGPIPTALVHRHGDGWRADDDRRPLRAPRGPARQQRLESNGAAKFRQAGRRDGHDAVDCRVSRGRLFRKLDEKRVGSVGSGAGRGGTLGDGRGGHRLCRTRGMGSPGVRRPAAAELRLRGRDRPCRAGVAPAGGAAGMVRRVPGAILDVHCHGRCLQRRGLGRMVPPPQFDGALRAPGAYGAAAAAAAGRGVLAAAVRHSHGFHRGPFTGGVVLDGRVLRP